MGSENRNCCENTKDVVVCTNYQPDFGHSWAPKVDVVWVEDEGVMGSTERTRTLPKRHLPQPL